MTDKMLLKHHPNLGGSKTGISSKMNIPTPCALKASFQIFGRGMRTHAHEVRERSVVKLRCLLNAYQSRSGYVRRVRFLVRVAKRKKKKQDGCPAFLFGDAYGNRTHVTAVKGPCLSRLTNGPYRKSLAAFSMVAEVGFEPTTCRV